jgi:tetratricopeptide (TPR) repeat protein
MTIIDKRINPPVISFLCMVIWGLAISACDVIDPTNVKNPQTTEESLREGGTGATRPFLNGVIFRFSDAVEDVAYYTDVVSDNYDNISTFISPQTDLPRSILPSDLTLNHSTSGPYFEVQELRALADFTLSGVIPNDAEATSEQRAEATFYRGMANLIAAENFVAVPVVEDGPAIPGNQLAQLAIDDFKAALAISQHADFATRIHLVLARAYRLAGDKAMAVAEANLALAGPQNFAFSAPFDAANNINDCFTYAVSRANNDVQPLPRLDFLDPKYIDRDKSIAAAKSEEAHLILAEAALSDGDYAGAVQSLVNAINLARNRATVVFVDRDPRRGRPAGGTVQAGPAAPALAGLILPRAGAQVSVPAISGTSLDPAAVAALTAPVEILRALYLARQEIFFFEGRRMSDLGIRLPIMQRELETNNQINPGDLSTVVLVPAYIPDGDGLDAFTVSGNNTIIAVDMNQVLADNRVSPFNLPF